MSFRVKSLILGVLILACPTLVRAQSWTGILDPSRATVWGAVGVQGGIPNYSTICSRVSPSGDMTGATDRTAINNALSTCAALASSTAPQVVLLAAGTYYLDIGIEPPVGSNYLVLRGGGPDKTILKFSGTGISNCGRGSGVDICFAGNGNSSDGFPGGTTAWVGTNDSVGTYTQGASLLDLTSTTGLVAGMIVNLDQRDDSIGLCPQSGGTGNCTGVTGLTHSGTTVTAVTSAPYSEITAGASVFIGTDQNHSLDGACNGYQSGITPWTVVSATTTASNTTFTYTDSNTLGSPTANCQPIYAAVDNGGIFNCGIDASCQMSNVSAGRVCPDTASGNQCASGEYSRREQDEAHIIVAVCTGAGVPNAACKATNEIVIDGQVLAPNYRTASNPGAWWTNSGASKFSNYEGLESLTVDATSDGTPFATIDLLNTVNSWVRNVRSLNAHGIHVGLELSVHSVVEDSYFFGTQHTGPQSYGIDTLDDNTGSLIQNNILQHILSGLQTEQSYGNVMAYNYVVDEHYGMTNSMVASMDANHGVAGDNLTEGNDANSCQSDSIHGPSFAITYFRNRCLGQDTPARPANGTLVAASDAPFQRVENFVGNVLGTLTFQSTYSFTSVLPPLPGQAIYFLNSDGYIENGSGQIGLNDPIVSNTLMRWGNYDIVSGAVRWCGNSSDTGWVATCSSTSEIPTSGVAYVNGNPVPTVGDTAIGQPNLPNSFYLSSQPTFWRTPFGTPPWPPIGPDVTASGTLDATCTGPATACDGVAHHSFQIPAQICYNNTATDPAYQSTWSGSTASESSTTVTVTLPASVTGASNPLTAVDTVSITGMSVSGYNGVWQVSATGGSSGAWTFQFTDTASGLANATGGTVNWPNILLFDADKCYTFGSSRSMTSPIGFHGFIG